MTLDELRKELDTIKAPGNTEVLMIAGDTEFRLACATTAETLTIDKESGEDMAVYDGVVLWAAADSGRKLDRE